MASHILRVVLDKFALKRDLLDFRNQKHVGRAGHLSDSVGEEEDALSSGLPDPLKDVAHTVVILPPESFA